MVSPTLLGRLLPSDLLVFDLETVGFKDAGSMSRPESEESAFIDGS